MPVADSGSLASVAGVATSAAEVAAGACAGASDSAGADSSADPADGEDTACSAPEEVVGACTGLNCVVSSAPASGAGAGAGAAPPESSAKIGRASCRERVEKGARMHYWRDKKYRRTTNMKKKT